MNNNGETDYSYEFYDENSSKEEYVSYKMIISNVDKNENVKLPQEYFNNGFDFVPHKETFQYLNTDWDNKNPATGKVYYDIFRKMSKSNLRPVQDFNDPKLGKEVYKQLKSMVDTCYYYFPVYFSAVFDELNLSLDEDARPLSREVGSIAISRVQAYRITKHIPENTPRYNMIRDQAKLQLDRFNDFINGKIKNISFVSDKENMKSYDYRCVTVSDIHRCIKDFDAKILNELNLERSISKW